jgi:hypothetical protein
VANPISPDLERKYSRELAKTLDQIDNLLTDLKEELKERKGEIAALEKAAYRLRLMLKGHGDQAQIPGAELPSIRPSRRDVGEKDV